MRNKADQVVMDTNLPDILHKGKVRDTYAIGSHHLLMVATDRISAFDVVLPTAIPQKGIVLSSLSAYWFEKTRDIVENHFISMAEQGVTPEELKDHELLSSLPQAIRTRGMIVKRAQRIDIECVVRGYITGSAWAEYQKSGTVGGDPMPAGMKDGDAFPEPLFTPTTKAETGHDMPMTIDEVKNMVGSDTAKLLQDSTLNLYNYAHSHALSKGIIIADTKVEFGFLDNKLILIDELLTPDSSRFWDINLYQPGKSQPNFDKQYVRDWLTESGWDREPPGPELPNDIVNKTTERYIQAYQLITEQPWAHEQMEN